MVNIGRDLHMAEGEGESSYSKNSSLQEKAILETKPILEKATREVYTSLLPQTMVIADLGCSSGPNALLVVSEVINAIGELDQCNHVELQFVLNDLPGNDFNQLFKSLEQFKKLARTNHKGDQTLPMYYVSGLPCSFYTRLFPRQTVHLFHSSYCLHWRSQVPEGLEEKIGTTYINEGNIYIAKNTPMSVVKLYQEQFQKDFSLFLKLRHEELVFGGKMVLTFPGRKNEDVFSGDLNHVTELLTQSLQHLIAEGLVEKEKLDSFNLPLYGPSIGEVEALVNHDDLFDIDHMELFESNWDPYDNTEGDVVHDSIRSGVNTAKWMRAVMEPFVAVHFGEAILDMLFMEYARQVAKHLETEKTKFALIILSMKKKKYP